MSSRGARIRNGHVTTTEYFSSKMVYDAKVLAGNKGNHGLPDYSHTPNSKYIKENPNGTFREMRIYNEHGEPILEIGYHPEPNITGNRHDPVLHAHKINHDLSRTMIGEISKSINSNIYNEYKKYLEVYGL